jgi:hypothetical protein
VEYETDKRIQKRKRNSQDGPYVALISRTLRGSLQLLILDMRRPDLEMSGDAMIHPVFCKAVDPGIWTSRFHPTSKSLPCMVGILATP